MVCVSCKSYTRVPGARYCSRCGAPLSSLLWSESTAAEGNAATDASGLSQACRRCGKENPETAVYCVHCGSRLGAEEHVSAADAEEAARAVELTATAGDALSRGAVERARSLCKEVLALDPRNAKAHALLAEIYQREGGLASALEEMTAAVRYDPDNTEFVQRLRALREEQERVIAPMVRRLEEPRERTFRPRQSRRRMPGARMPRVGNAVQVPDWLKALLLIVAIMVVIGLFQGPVGSVMLVLSYVLTGLVTIFVFQDARSQGMSLPVAAAIAGGICLLSLSRSGLGLLAFLFYLVATRSRR